MKQEPTPVVARKKLIEVALPLDAINKASAREKSIRHGHPSTLHLWWARRPLAAARAVIFAQMVDDPSANPDLFRTPKAREKERQRLFRIIEDLVKWENTSNEEVLQRARDEIWQSWRRACADNAEHPRAKELFDRHVLPAFHDPFAGGGSLPLEAQRLGLEAHASDLNPVAVLINKAMIEIPPMFAGRQPINPESQGQVSLMDQTWRGAQGLAEDVRYYGRWMRDEAEQRIGHFYPKVQVTADTARNRPDLEPYVGRNLTVIAWIWARTVKSPNPAFAHMDVPLASTFILSKKKGKEAWVEPVLGSDGYHFAVRAGNPVDGSSAKSGTKVGRANFVCLVSGTPIPGDYIKAEGKAGRIGSRLMAIVAEGDRSRVYLPPSEEMEHVAHGATPEWRPDLEISGSTQYIGVKPYGMNNFGDLFTNRQLVALTTVSSLVVEAREHVQRDAILAGMPDDNVPLRDGGTGALAYAEAVGLYLAFAVDKGANYWSTICAWHQTRDGIVSTFGRQAIPMVWDYSEANPFCNSSGNLLLGVTQAAKMLDALGVGKVGEAVQADARAPNCGTGAVISTDPPYYDNVPYADLSDFFFVWLRSSIGPVIPDLFATVSSPKLGELVAFAYRHGNKADAESYFLNGMTRAMERLAKSTHPVFPTTIYYAFRQSETRSTETISTGWDTFLEAVLRAGFTISGTWPVRTEYTGNLKSKRNALASSVVLVCRPAAANAPSATRREFQNSLRLEFPRALSDLQRANVAPVDLAQASIGPGMAIFSRYRDVLNADGSQMSVRDALALINASLDEVLAEQEGDFDADSRWALTWFEQHGYDEGQYGVAEQLSKAKNTSVDGLVRAGLIESWRGSVRLLEPSELDPDWNPSTDRRLTVWEMTHHLIRLLETSEQKTADLAGALGSDAETARDLAYRLYTICERKQRAADALQYNSLVQSWPEIAQLAQQRPRPRQTEMLSQAEDGP